MMATPLIANEAMPLDSALTLPNLWELTGEGFYSEHQAQGFRWISTAQDVAQNTKRGTTLFGLPVCQTLVRIKDGKVDHYTAMFYNRGDMGDLRREPYEELLKKVVEAVTTHVGQEPKQRGRDQSSAVRAFGWEWKTPHSDYLLEYSFTRENQSAGVPYRAEFIRLEVSPKEAPKSFLTEAFSTIDKPEKYDGPKQVSRDDHTGDVFIKDVPMVDQGDKGYCVVASVERVMRLYGTRVDANELAQLANSSASEGTSVNAMADSLRSLTSRLKIKVRTQIKFDDPKFRRFLNDYNMQARRAKVQLISIGRGSTLTDLYVAMDPEVLRETKGKSRSDFTAFQRHIKAHIDRGVPMLWSVIMGVIPEQRYNGGPGGHMRLIIGYNEKTQEIIYSDSWGMGHESKKMPMLDAFAITTGLNSVEPL